jgi:hypothetical protein
MRVKFDFKTALNFCQFEYYLLCSGDYSPMSFIRDTASVDVDYVRALKIEDETLPPRFRATKQAYIEYIRDVIKPTREKYLKLKAFW